jgi:hypothetical protein
MASSQLSAGELTVVIATLVLGLAVWIFFAERARRRGLRVAGQRLRERTPCPDEEFVAKLGFAPGSREAAAALGVRLAVAETLGVAPETMTPTTSPSRDPDLRPFCDSLDVVLLFERIQERLNVSIPDRVLGRIQDPVSADDLGGTIRRLLALIADPSPPIPLTIQVAEQPAGRWVARVPELSGWRFSGPTRDQVVARAKQWALHSLAERRGQALSEAAVRFSVSA